MHTSRRVRAFSLVEVVMAIGILSFCLVALIGLVPVGLKQESLLIRRTSAMQAMSAVEADLRTMTKAGASPLYQISIPDSGGSVGGWQNFWVDDSLRRTEDPSARAFGVSLRWIQIPASRFSSYQARIAVFPPSVIPKEDGSHLQNHAWESLLSFCFLDK